MNLHRFQTLLEEAVENRDESALAELERCSAETPETDRLWKEHQQLDDLISAWCLCQQTPEGQDSVPASPGYRHLRSLTVVASTVAAAALLMVGYFYYPSGTDVADSQLVLVANQNSPSIEKTPTATLALRITQRELLRDALDTTSYPEGSLQTNDLTGLQASMGISVVSDVHQQLTQEISQVWQVLANLPDDVEQVYDRIEPIIPESETEAEQEQPIQPSPFQGLSVPFLNLLS